ncbi:MAG: exo-alpha-sialidase [Anaerolineae bacterium]
MTSSALLWAPELPLPQCASLPLPGRIEQLVIHRSSEPWAFLHESCLCVHRGRLYAAWNACRQAESGPGSVVHWTASDDGGYTWSAARLLAQPLEAPETIWESCQLYSDGDMLWAFTGQVHTQPRTPAEAGGRTVILQLDEAAADWQAVGALEGFQPLNPPQHLPDGSLLMGGQYNLNEPRAARCSGTDLTAWEAVPIPYRSADQVHFAETALICTAEGCTAVVRSAAAALYTSQSRDGGHRWTNLELSNLPAADSKTCAGTLTSGQYYLALNLRSERTGSLARDLLAILVSAPGRMPLRKAVCLRAGTAPRARWPGFGKVEQWSYPSVAELDGRVYVSYSITKEDLGLAILPLAELQV